MSRVSVLLVAVCLSAAGLTAPAAVPSGASSPQQSALRAGVHTVSIYATVTDPAGAIAGDLTHNDLVVTDAADNCSRSDISAVRTALQRDGVVVYAVGVRGREGLPLGELAAVARTTGG